MNVIVIVSDTFRHDYLGCCGNNWIDTSNLDAFARKATIFERAYAASFPTVPHRHDLFTGKYTFTFSDWAPLPKKELVLSFMLRQAGCVTQLIADTPHIVKDGFNFDRDYDGWLWIRGQEGERLMTSPKKVVLPCDAKKLRYGAQRMTQYLREVSLRRFESDYFVAQTMTSAIEWLELNYDQHQKFFLHVDTFDPHEPWDPPRWYVDRYDRDYEGEEVFYPIYGPSDYLTSSELNHCKALYSGEVTMVDRWIGKLLQKVDDLGLLDDTAIIFTSDHGFYHGEHNLVGKSILSPKATGYCPLYEEVARIPLLVYLPSVKGGQYIRELVQPQDITATILDLAGAKQPPGIQGSSILPLTRGEEINWRKYAITSPSIIYGPIKGERITFTSRDWSFIFKGQVEDALKSNPGKTRAFNRLVELAGEVENELYNLSKDPKQQNNVYEEEKEVAKQMHSELLCFLRNAGVKSEHLEYWRNLQ